MYNFDERALVRQLEGLPSRDRIAFAAAAATRQLGNVERFCSASSPRRIATQLWAALRAEPVELSAWSRHLDEAMSLLDELDEGDWVARALAVDGLASLAYAIRCFLTKDAQEAAWAARRAYEAADQIAILALRALDKDFDLNKSEADVSAHLLVQRELERQRNDSAHLLAGSIELVERQAFLDELVTDEELLQMRD